MGRARLLVGISVFWLALSMLFDGLNTLVLPDRLLAVTADAHRATTLGLLTFGGIVAGMLVQPIAGACSDRVRPRWGRRGPLALGVLLMLASLAVFGVARSLPALFAGYLLVLVAASIAQAAQQGFIPDLIPPERRGTAAGLKGLMDVGGAMLGFVVLGQFLGGGRLWLALLAIAAVILVAFALTVALVREPTAPTLAAPARIGLVETFRIDVQDHRAFIWLVASRFLFLLGVYAVGRFFLFYIVDRLGFDAAQAAERAGTLLAGLALITVLASPPSGWASDRFGRVPVMLTGAGLSASGVLLLIPAEREIDILIAGSLMSLGSAAFAAANWAFTADLAPPAEAARFLGLANAGTAGAAATAGLFGLLVDGANRVAPGAGYPALFVAAALAILASAVALRGVAPGQWAAATRSRAV